MITLLPKDGKRISVYFDVDDTLIVWVENTDPDAENAVVVDDCVLGIRLVRPIPETVQKLKKHHEKGDLVVVWSQGGADWAENVVRALGLEDYVDVCLCKPERCYDDLNPNVWMTEKWVAV